jgi:hypothetical protein
MPLIERTPDFLVYMLSAWALSAKAAAAASRAVVRTIVDAGRWQSVVGEGLKRGESSQVLMSGGSHNGGEMGSCQAVLSR